jgi:hypothetical protein
MQRMRYYLTILIPVLMTLSGCTAISIAPECPEELKVGDSGTVRANQMNPGEIATYLWEVFPPDAGTFADETAPETTFQAQREVDVVIRLTASDGLYQVISQCSTRIRGGADAAVSLQVSPASPTVGETVTLTCTALGEEQPTALVITQTDGDDVELTEVSDGVVTFTPAAAGSLSFSCVSEDADGNQSEPAQLSVTVAEPSNGNENDNGAANENDNTNDNDNVNDNGGGGRPPPVRP